MTTDWDRFFERWAEPPSVTETDERDRTEKEIRNALDAWPGVARRNKRVFVKGSYRSRTNVRRGSDLDIAVELRGLGDDNESFLVQRTGDAAGLSDGELGLTDAPVGYGSARATFKGDVHRALVDVFGASRVTWNNKCVTVAGSATMLPVDVVPCSTYRLYQSRAEWSEGIRIVPDTGPDIVNWPDYDYDNGVTKNRVTSKRYKRVVRGLKALENVMADAGHPETASWLVECLVYNVPSELFTSTSNYENVDRTLRWLWSALGEIDTRAGLVEVNQRKYLFTPTQPWTVADAALFVADARDWIDGK